MWIFNNRKSVNGVSTNMFEEMYHHLFYALNDIKQYNDEVIGSFVDIIKLTTLDSNKNKAA